MTAGSFRRALSTRHLALSDDTELCLLCRFRYDAIARQLTAHCNCVHGNHSSVIVRQYREIWSRPRPGAGHFTTDGVSCPPFLLFAAWAICARQTILEDVP
jgi:hypothetical protein